MIYYSQPYNVDKNIGQYYNEEMEMLPNDFDFRCFTDGDSMFTTQTYGHALLDYVEMYPECGVFVCMTNRIGCEWQCLPGVNKEDHDMRYHRRLGEKLQAEQYGKIEDVSNVHPGKVLGGVLILIRKDVWKKVGGFKTDGILGVDNHLHWACQKHGEKVYLMKGIYTYHWYRGETGDKSHLL